MAAERSSKMPEGSIMPQIARPAKPTAVATRIILDDANNGFQNGNLVCSPFSVEVLVGMLAAGAQGQTLKQLLEFLGHETLDKVLYESASSKLLQLLISNPNHADQGDLDIVLANGIWVDEKLNRVQSSYEEVLNNVYKTKAIFMNFVNKPDEIARNINSWVNKKTRGLIPTIVNRSDLSKEKVVLANALYFKLLWSEPFNARSTEDKDFHLINGEKVVVPFMTNISEIQYGSFNDYKMIKLPYGCDQGLSSKYSMYIFLPHMKDGLQDVLQMFDSNYETFHIDYKLRWWELDELWVPKFKISYKLDAKDVMKQLGLTLPFEPTNMDLRSMVDSKSPDGDMLYVSKILQQSFIEVDERGTKATYVSSMYGKPMCANYKPPSPGPSFVADHPFIFMIREDTFRSVLFIGVVVNPKLSI